MTTSISLSQVVSNYRELIDRVAQAAARSGRNPQEVEIVGVTKYVGVQEAAWLVEAGCLQLGESRPQSLWQKSEALANPKLAWHLIGHLQRNKVAKTLEHVDCIHSVDSVRLLQQISRDAGQIPAGKRVKLLVEVNVTPDGSKTGLSLQDSEKLLESWCEQKKDAAFPRNIEITGLMGMASLEGNEADARKEFDLIREHRDAMSRRFALELPDLSMGMSGDFEWAIASGATLVRIGSSLFQPGKG